MLTIENIRNPKRKSGFNNVGSAGGHGKGHGGGKPWAAHAGHKKSPGGHPVYAWRGKRRATAEEAAQDYCDYINEQRAPQPVSLTTAGHPGLSRNREKHPKLVEADALRREALADSDPDLTGWVYAIGEVDSDEYIKVGKSKEEPKYRLKGLQTGNPRLLKVYGERWVTDRAAAERALHAQFAKWNALGEWFSFVDEIREEFEIEEGIIDLV